MGKNPIDIETLNSWTDEFIDSRDGKKVILTKEEENELREKYKEKYGEYPPEPKEGVYFIRNI